jgi:hypothetical protein
MEALRPDKRDAKKIKREAQIEGAGKNTKQTHRKEAAWRLGAPMQNQDKITASMPKSLRKALPENASGLRRY